METAVVLFTVVVAPIWLALHYITKWRTSRAFTKDDQQVLEELWQLAKTMEERVKSLETILEADKGA